MKCREEPEKFLGVKFDDYFDKLKHDHDENYVCD
jgi:hypothetical protein